MQYTYSYVAISNTTRITFAIREDSGAFALDDVSVVNVNAPSVQLIANGDFETGSSSPEWLYCDPNNLAGTAYILPNSANLNWGGAAFQAHSGSYCYLAGAVSFPDYLSQTFLTKISDTYNVSYWLFNRGTGTASSVDVWLSI